MAEQKLMKNIKIGDTTYPLHIGFAFVRELDRRYTETVAGVSYGFGISKLTINLIQKNPLGILDFIQAATITLDNPPTAEEIEAEFDKFNLEEFYVNFLTLLEESSVTKENLKDFQQLMNQAING